MCLSAYTEKGVNYPVLICGTCGKRIEDARKAIVVFPDLGGNPVSHATGIYRKGRCDPGNQAEPYCDELDRYLRQLICNLKVGEMVIRGNKRQLVIDLPKPNDFLEIIGQPNW